MVEENDRYLRPDSGKRRQSTSIIIILNLRYRNIQCDTKRSHTRDQIVVAYKRAQGKHERDHTQVADTHTKYDHIHLNWAIPTKNNDCNRNLNLVNGINNDAIPVDILGVDRLRLSRQ